MKSRLQKTITSLLLIAALAISGISYQGKEAKAADNYTTILDTAADHVLDPGEIATHDLPLATNGQILIDVYNFANTDMTVSVSSQTGTVLSSITIPRTDSGWSIRYDSEGYSYYLYTLTWQPPTAGNYKLSLSFSEITAYLLTVSQGPAVQVPSTPTQTPVKTPTPSLNAQNVTVTVGFTQTISVTNASDAITWSSSKSSVATVSNGKITGKKAGTATITAKTAGGYTMTCNVTVKKNVYSVKKLSVKQITYNKSGIDIYNVSYDKKGNLVIKSRVLNNTSYKIQELRNVKIKIKDNNGKVIGTYSAKKIKKVNLKAGKAKAYTFKIKKAKLKNKKANLPLITTSVSGKAYYIR